MPEVPYGVLPSDRQSIPYHEKTDAEILTDAREHLRSVKDMESEIRAESAECQRFRALKQWKETIINLRGDRPTLVIDQLGKNIDQVVNDWRRSRLGGKVSPGDSPADPEHAKVLNGWIRQREYESKAHIAYDWAAECMIGNNRGFLKITTKRRKGSFKQDPYIVKIPNADCVYMDQFCKEADYSDQRRTLVTDVLSLKAYEAEYPGFSTADFAGFAGDPEYSDWITGRGVTVGEWWVVEELPRKIQLLTKPIAIIRNERALKTDTVYDNEYEKLPEGVEIQVNSDGDPMEDDEPIRVVWQFLLNGAQIISRTRWKGSIIPIVPFLGKELYLEGKKRLYSLISRGLDSQRLLNYAKSSLAERLGQFPKNPVMALNGQIASDIKAWENMNTVPHAFVVYDPVQLPDGTYHTAPPQRADFDPHIDQMAMAVQQGKEDIKGSIGLYGASLGDHEGKARSGIAERALQQEGDNATFDFLDNGGRGVELATKILVELFPKLVSGPDIIQIRDDDDKVTSVAVNQSLKTMANPPKDQTQDFSFAEGTYHVAISSAPTAETLREEGAEMSMEVLKIADPEERKKLLPIVLRKQTWPGAVEMADALDPPQADNGMVPIEVAQQAQQMIDALTQALDKLTQEQESKQAELDSRERIAAMQSRVDVIKIQADTLTKHEQMASDESMEIFKAEIAKEMAQLNAQINSLASTQDHVQGEVSADAAQERMPEEAPAE